MVGTQCYYEVSKVNCKKIYKSNCGTKLDKLPKNGTCPKCGKKITQSYLSFLIGALA